MCVMCHQVTYLVSKIDQSIDRHAFFLEPLSVTQSLKSMDISLAPNEPHKYLRRMVSSEELDNQILVGVSYIWFMWWLLHNAMVGG